MPDDPMEKPKQSLDGVTGGAASENTTKPGEAFQKPWAEPSESTSPKSFDSEPTTSVSAASTPVSAPATDGSPVISSSAIGSATPAMGAASAAPASFGAQKSKKKLVIGIVSAVVGVLAIGGGVAAYLWHQNPDKILTDSFINIMTAKSSVVDATTLIKSDALDMKVVYSAKGDANKAGGNVALEVTPKGMMTSMGTIKLDADGAFDQDGTIYFKVNNVKSTVEKVMNAYIDESAKGAGASVSPAQIASAKSQAMAKITPVVNEVDGKWIKITPQDIKELTGSDKDSFTCFKKAGEKLRTDKAMSEELYKLYQKNKFITIKKQLGNKDGNVGFEITGDEAKAKTFGNEVKNTAFGKQLKACDDKIFSESTSSAVDTTSSANTTVSVWIGEWSHTLNKVSIKSDDSKNKMNVNFDMSAKYNTSINVDIPKDAKPIKQVISKIESMTGSMYGGSSTSMPSPVSSSFKLGL